MISKLAESGSGRAGQNRTITRRARDASKIHIEFPNVRKVTTENDHYHKNRSRATPVNVGSGKSPKGETAKFPLAKSLSGTEHKHTSKNAGACSIRMVWFHREIAKVKETSEKQHHFFSKKICFSVFQFFGSDFFQKSLIAYFIRKNKPAKKTGSNSEYAL